MKVLDKLILIGAIECISLVQAQYMDTFTYGLKVGALHSNMTNLPEMIIGRDYNKTQFTMDHKGGFGVEGGVFANYKLPHSRVALQPELLYRKTKSQVLYHNTITNQEYTVDFNYSYLVLGASFKVYPYKGLTVGVGAFYAKNLNPSALEYTSNEFDGRYDTNYRQFYREGIVGKDDFNLSCSVGYELAEAFHFEARYYMGVGDAVGNRSTSFQFLENTNRTSTITLALGYNFSNW
ncbi:outer membrane beta-barrel protein [Riemerella columbina]|uniref:outer membrane beta-barrel protein n=1 Tax=Riemerella columbina TaxID=103810 RepID=UPI00037EEFD3|nr:outer membrane beta-barrel protein [Riemerella columbina]